MLAEQDFRTAWPSVVRVLAAWCGDLDAAEEHAAEAFARLVAQDPLPADAAAWCVQVGKRSFLDARRREATAARVLPDVGREAVTADGYGPGPGVVDDRVALLHVACDDALSANLRLVLALRVVCGLTVPEVARHLGIAPAAAAARLTRAKRALAGARAGFAVPGPEERRLRLPSVLDCVAGMFNLAHRETPDPVDALADTGRQALSLADALAAQHPADAEVAGLRAVVRLGLARRPGRVDADGVAVPLEEVDRGRWDAGLVAAGLAEAARATTLLGGGPPGRFVLEAAISGVHTVAPSLAATDWERLEVLYEALERAWPSPAVRVARLVARTHGAREPTVLAAVERDLETVRRDGPGYAVRDAGLALADLRWRTGRRVEAATAYAALAAEATSEPVRRFCERRAGG